MRRSPMRQRRLRRREVRRERGGKNCGPCRCAAGRSRRPQGPAAARARGDGEHPQAQRTREGRDAKYAVTRFARDVLTVGDNFQRAIEAVPAEAAEQDAALKSFLEGVTMTERELLNVLERHGHLADGPARRTVQSAPPSGRHGNAEHRGAAWHRHAGFQAGYMIEDRVLRPAMVVVAKGGPKPAARTRVPATSAPR